MLRIRGGVPGPGALVLKLRAQFRKPELDLESLVFYDDSLNEIPECALPLGRVRRVPQLIETVPQLFEHVAGDLMRAKVLYESFFLDD
jgi:hypothetical protein